MLTCPNPTCGKKLAALERECPRCRTNLSLLVDYVDHLQDGLARAEALTRAGELGDAVWAYLSVLEVDPDNATARRQVGQVVTAVRQFDETMPGRRWLRKVRSKARLRAWRHSLGGEDGAGWFGMALGVLVILGALILGYTLGVSAPPPRESMPYEDKKPPMPPGEKNRDARPISD